MKRSKTPTATVKPESKDAVMTELDSKDVVMTEVDATAPPTKDKKQQQEARGLAGIEDAESKKEVKMADKQGKRKKKKRDQNPKLAAK